MGENEYHSEPRRAGWSKNQIKRTSIIINNYRGSKKE